MWIYIAHSRKKTSNALITLVLLLIFILRNLISELFASPS